MAEPTTKHGTAGAVRPGQKFCMGGDWYLKKHHRGEGAKGLIVPLHPSDDPLGVPTDLEMPMPLNGTFVKILIHD